MFALIEQRVTRVMATLDTNTVDINDISAYMNWAVRGIESNYGTWINSRPGQWVTDF